MPVLIENRQQKVNVDTGKLKRLAQEILEQEGVSDQVELSIALVNKKTIRDLNSRYRGVDEPTDVLSFPMNTGKGESFSLPVILLGDVLICPEIALVQARKLNHSLDEELSLLLIHGILNLLGKKDRGRQ